MSAYCLHCGLTMEEHTRNDLFWCRKELYRQELVNRINGLSEDEALDVLRRELTEWTRRAAELQWP